MYTYSEEVKKLDETGKGMTKLFVLFQEALGK